MTPQRFRLSAGEARELAMGALCAIGYEPEESAIIADHVVDAALCGYQYSGLAKILNIPENRHFKEPRRPLSVRFETEASVLFDGGNTIGMVAAYRAAEAAIKKASARGFALVGLGDSWMSGRSAYYVEMIAKADLVAIHTAAASRAVAPPGGVRAALGTNPIAFAVPSAEGPLVFDMGTSAFMATEAAYLERLGKSLPDGAAIDSEGRPTRDPKLAREGAFLPFGGYKGFGLAFMVGALGLLAGSTFPAGKEEGYLFIAFKPELLAPLEEFKSGVARLVRRIKATPKAKGVAEIRIPSERAFRSRERLLREGIEIDRLVYEELAALRDRGNRG